MTNTFFPLHQFGPSLMTPGTDLAFKNPSTNTLLDSFVADPASGRLFVPMRQEVAEGQTHVSIRMAELGPTNADRYVEQTHIPLLEDGKKLKTKLERIGLAFPNPLVASAGRWAMMEPNLDEHQTDLSLVSVDRKFIGLKSVHGQGTDRIVAVGWNGQGALLTQKLVVTSNGSVRGLGYRFHFFEDACEGLASFLNLGNGYSHGDLALAVAKAVYTSDQYTDEEAGPLVSIQSAPKELIVKLKPSRYGENALMPLTSSLRNLLWDVGMEFVYQN